MRKYTKEHEWIDVDVDEDGGASVGITDYAQEQLGDIVYVDFLVTAGPVGHKEAVATIEAVKTVSDIYMPVDGVVTEVNEELEDNANRINDTNGEEYIFKIKVDDPGQLDQLMTEGQYAEYLNTID